MICFKHHQLQSPTFLSFTQRANLSIPFLTSVSEGTHPVFLQGAVHCRPNACSRACWPPGSGRTSNQCLHFNPPRKTKLPETRHLFILLWILLFAKNQKIWGKPARLPIKTKNFGLFFIPSNCVIFASGRYGSELLPTMDCVTSPVLWLDFLLWPKGLISSWCEATGIGWGFKINSQWEVPCERCFWSDIIHLSYTQKKC